MDFERKIYSTSVRLSCESYLEAQYWSEQTRQSQGDYLKVGHVSSLSEEPYVKFTQNNMSELVNLWKLISITEKERFHKVYGNIVTLITYLLKSQYFERQ